MARHQPAHEVVGAPCRVADINRNRLPGKIRLLRQGSFKAEYTKPEARDRAANQCSD